MEAVVARFQVLFRHLRAGTNENSLDSRFALKDPNLLSISYLM
jgi:hypothetical protein